MHTVELERSRSRTHRAATLLCERSCSSIHSVPFSISQNRPDYVILVVPMATGSQTGFTRPEVKCKQGHCTVSQQRVDCPYSQLEPAISHCHTQPSEDAR
eukprot:3671095-Rhodomonas_salina.4